MKAQVTGSGGIGPLPNGQYLEPQKKAKKSPEAPATSTDVFHASVDSLPAESQESAQIGEAATPVAKSQPKEATVKPQAPVTQDATAPLLLTPEMQVDQFDSNTPLVLTQDQRVDLPQAEKEGLTFADLAKGVSRGVRSLFGDELASFEAKLDDINKLEKMAKQLTTPEQFKAKTAEFKDRLAAGETLADLRPEAYAVAREAARQATGMRAYDCQVIGALAMDDSHIAEMKTGEGKTLTAVLPLYLNALAGKGAHLVTVNETLAKRDAEWMGPIFKKMGMTVGCVTEDQSKDEKRANYNCDVTYVSDRALGFDFLKDRGALDPAERVQRGHFFALIDEVDEVLIDEARTPMILSGQSGNSSHDYKVFGSIIKTLVPGDDFKLDEEKRTVWLTDGGLNYVENELVIMEAKQNLAKAAPGSPEAKEASRVIADATELRGAIRKENAAQKIFDDLDYEKPNVVARTLGFKGEYDKDAATKAETELNKLTEAREKLAEKVPNINLYDIENTHRLPYMDASLKAHTQFRLGKDYTVEGGEVKIVDASKGRVSDGKRYSRGLHQALEVKEGLEPKAETRTISKITMPELMAQYERRAGMTGTGKTSEEEFIQMYGLDVIEIPTNKPILRKDHPDIVFATKEAKYQEVVRRATEAAKAGRPVLVGTISVNANRELAALFLEAGWPADQLQILNAETVKGGEDSHDPNAGRSGTITLTTGDKAKDVKHDKFNYKKIAFSAQEAFSQGKPVVIDMDSDEDAEQVRAWLAGSAPSDGLQIRVRKPGQEMPALPEGITHIDAKDHAVEKPLTYKVSEENLEEILPKALDAFAEGEPVVLESATQQSLGLVANALLDHGLGLGAIPMVCEGKEKENAMIEIAGRSNMITLSTNMAGRGANFKPDLVAISHISEKAYENAAVGKPTTITVRKEAEAVKIERLLKEFVGVSKTDDPNKQGKPGEVLVRYGKEMPELEGDNHFHRSDFATDGLLVLGTERGKSRRTDDQLIGRSGRQGNVGDSQFLISLEDEVPRIFGGENFEPLLDMFGDSQAGVTSDVVNKVMRKAQERVENQHYDQRFNSMKYQGVHRKQRDGWYQMREQILTEEYDTSQVVANFATEGFVEMIKSKLPDKKKFQPAELSKAVAEVAKEQNVPLSLNPAKAVKAKDLEDLLFDQVDQLFDHPNLNHDELRKLTLLHLDETWKDHLEAMQNLQDGIHLEAIGGKKPEDVFPHRAFEVFQQTMSALKQELAGKVVPRVADLHKPKRKKKTGPANNYRQTFKPDGKGGLTVSHSFEPPAAKGSNFFQVSQPTFSPYSYQVTPGTYKVSTDDFEIRPGKTVKRVTGFKEGNPLDAKDADKGDATVNSTMAFIHHSLSRWDETGDIDASIEEAKAFLADPTDDGTSEKPLNKDN